MHRIKELKPPAARRLPAKPGGQVAVMGDPLTEEERRRHLEHEEVFQRLASKHRRGSILHDLGKAIDRYNALQRHENSERSCSSRAGS